MKLFILFRMDEMDEIDEMDEMDDSLWTNYFVDDILVCTISQISKSWRLGL